MLVLVCHSCGRAEAELAPAVVCELCVDRARGVLGLRVLCPGPSGGASGAQPLVAAVLSAAPVVRVKKVRRRKPKVGREPRMPGPVC